jgi:rsbT co-antagonist protein RsbR
VQDNDAINNGISSRLQEENRQLRQRIDALETQLAGGQLSETEAVHLIEEKYQRLLDDLNAAYFRMRFPEGTYEQFSPTAKKVFGFDAATFLESPLLIAKQIHPDFADYFKEKWGELTQGHVAPSYEYQWLDPEGNVRWIVQLNQGVFDDSGNLVAVEGTCSDVTHYRQQEEERTRLQQQIIEAQEASLRELSTPLMPLSEGVLAMPLVGAIDSGRAQMVMETLLEGVSTHQAELAILDITGVQVIDTQVANALMRTAQAVKLLGAQVVLTGIQPRIAQTLVHLGVDLSEIVTRSTLQAGISYAMSRE